ncbi:plasmid partitioning protein RepB C-terminal domain-containing protein [Aureimonas sp. AU20]|uniref:plasmid partitioning protein RepB C-terminal domain-containing protein n=1 Tax=Aureimonas sp. AU20 TaxID=1349819 RepID=UPI000721393E|nr:plasmid partitioning protein RepB C-terminal domain-containing protein [Aureimonas sp. AU20]ALN72502.1 hypothetical protein M673_07235 [Aureimonas sp. AU20]
MSGEKDGDDPSVNDDGGVRLGFERETIIVPLDRLVPLRTFRPGMKESRKYAQILASVKMIGLVEPPAIAPDPGHPGTYFLLDGHIRVEALKDLGQTEVECLVSTDDEGYTYNKRINRLAAVQEHKMIALAVKRGVPEELIAEALSIEVVSVRRKFRMLNGICAAAVELLKDTICPGAVFDQLRRMMPARQIEAAELMIGQNNFSVAFAKALLVATPEKQLVQLRKPKLGGASAAAAGQIARMERELASLQTQVKSVEETYSIDNLHLTVAKGYVAKLLGNARIVRWLSLHRQEYLGELQSIAEISSLAIPPIAAE